MIVTLFKIEGCYFLLLFLVGLSIAPLSVSDRKEVMSIAHRWCLEDFDVVAFAYTPVHNSVRTISSLVYHTVLKKNPTWIILLYPSLTLSIHPTWIILLYPSLTLSTHATLLHGPHTFLQVEIFFQMPTGTFFSYWSFSTSMPLSSYFLHQYPLIPSPSFRCHIILTNSQPY